MPLWRRFLIVFLLVVELASLVALINVDNIIDSKLEPVTDDVYRYVDEHFGYDALSYEQQREFKERNRDKLEKYGNDPIEYGRATEILYLNGLYINTYGKEAYNESVYKYGDDAYFYREAQLRKRSYAQLYPIWEEEYCKYRKLSQEEDHKRGKAYIILYSITLICGLGIYFSSYRKIGRKKLQVYRLAAYCVLCEVLSIIIASLALGLNEETINGSYGLWALLFFPSVITIPAILTYLYRRTNRTGEQGHILIPQWLEKTNVVNSELSKRLFLVFISYPLFYLVPIPYGGIFVFIFYIIPMAIIFAIINILLWIAKGRKMDKKLQALKYDNSKDRIYCRFCGKLIDADSDYCRYCGKEL